MWFPGPESYTGEDMAEFHIHGSRAVINEIQNSLSQIPNLRLAEAGEFTKLAFQNGKINLLKAESIADLISSETEIQRRQAIKIMSGKSADKFNVLRKRLLKILSNKCVPVDLPVFSLIAVSPKPKIVLNVLFVATLCINPPALNNGVHPFIINKLISNVSFIYLLIVICNIYITIKCF